MRTDDDKRRIRVAVERDHSMLNLDRQRRGAGVRELHRRDLLGYDMHIGPAWDAYEARGVHRRASMKERHGWDDD